jgi:branched-chain amino acid transport system ATP-binding protein
MHNDGALLEARDLRVRDVRDAAILDEIGLIAHPGEMVAVVGPNGSGKSTLLRALAGLTAVRSGTIHLNGHDVTLLPAHRRAALGLAYATGEDRGATGRLSVRDSVLVGAWLRRDRYHVMQDLERILERFPSLNVRRRDPAAFLSVSGRRLLAIARALMGRSRVLLLDETLLELEDANRTSVIEALEEARSQGRSIVAAEREVPAVERLAVRVYALFAGRLAFTGSATGFRTSAAFVRLYG